MSPAPLRNLGIRSGQEDGKAAQARAAAHTALPAGGDAMEQRLPGHLLRQIIEASLDGLISTRRASGWDPKRIWLTEYSCWTDPPDTWLGIAPLQSGAGQQKAGLRILGAADHLCSSAPLECGRHPVQVRARGVVDSSREEVSPSPRLHAAARGAIAGMNSADMGTGAAALRPSALPVGRMRFRGWQWLSPDLLEPRTTARSASFARSRNTRLRI